MKGSGALIRDPAWSRKMTGILCARKVYVFSVTYGFVADAFRFPSDVNGNCIDAFRAMLRRAIQRLVVHHRVGAMNILVLFCLASVNAQFFTLAAVSTGRY